MASTIADKTAYASDYQRYLVERLHTLGTMCYNPQLSQEAKDDINAEIQKIAREILWRAAHF